MSVVKFVPSGLPLQNAAKGAVGCSRVISLLVLSEASATAMDSSPGVVGIVASLEAPSAASALHVEPEEG